MCINEGHQILNGSLSDEPADNFRLRSMNFTASKIIAREMAVKKCKWMALMGLHHVKKQEGVTGMAELTGARSVRVYDYRGEEAQ